MKSILVVDDERDILELVKDILLDKYIVYLAQNAREAILILEKNKVDLIVLDIMMPEIDGWDFMSLIKGHEIYRNIPVIVLTARADAENKLIGLKEGVKDYIVKPFLPSELLLRIEEILKEKN